MSSCQRGGRSGRSQMSRRSKLERVGKHNLQTCARDESCQSNALHEVSNRSLVVSTVAVCRKSVTLVEFAPRTTFARLNAVSSFVRKTNLGSCKMSKTI